MIAFPNIEIREMNVMTFDRTSLRPKTHGENDGWGEGVLRGNFMSLEEGLRGGAGDILSFRGYFSRGVGVAKQGVYVSI